MTNRAIIREVGLRDGLQLVKRTLPARTKLTWCRLEADCNVSEIEVTSFVPSEVIPQFADAEKVLEGAQSIKGLCATVLVPNLKGGVRALDFGARKITFVLSASEAHNKANVKRSTDDSMREFRELVRERNRRGLTKTIEISAAIATAFGCSLQGEVPERRVFSIAEKLLVAEANELNIADTVGYANPVQVRRVLGEIAKSAGVKPLAAHFHDTRAMGLANIMAALEAGVLRFDAALGGLGGCPFAPGASGNIATEDCVYLLESVGLDTGIDLPALLDVRRKLDGWLPGEHLHGSLYKAGVAKTFSQVR